MSQSAAPSSAAPAHARSALGGSSWTTVHRSLFVRLVAAFMVVSLAAISFLVVVLSQQETAALSTDASIASENVARAAASKLESWLQQRQSDMNEYAALFQGQLSDVGAMTARLGYLGHPHPDDVYDLLQVTDPSGRVIAAS